MHINKLFFFFTNSIIFSDHYLFFIVHYGFLGCRAEVGTQGQDDTHLFL